MNDYRVTFVTSVPAESPADALRMARKSIEQTGGHWLVQQYLPDAIVTVDRNGIKRAPALGGP